MSKYSIAGENSNEALEPLIGGIESHTNLPFNGRFRVLPQRGQVYTGQCSWFGQFGTSGFGEGMSKYKWTDREDNGQNASGLSQMTPGIAYMATKSIRHWFKLTFPNGKSFIIRQVDVGPSGWTGKMIDVNAPLAEMAGYSPKTFPTGAIVRFQYIGAEEPYGATKEYRRPE